MKYDHMRVHWYVENIDIVLSVYEATHGPVPPENNQTGEFFING